MGQTFSRLQKYYKLPESVWGYGGTESTVGGLYLSSTKNAKGDIINRLYLQVGDRRKTVFFKVMNFIPTGIEITMPDDGSISVYFMNGETSIGDPVVWKKDDYELDKYNNLVKLKVKNDNVSAVARASVVVQSNAAARASVFVQRDAESSEIDSLPKRLLTSSAHNIISGDWSVLSELNVLLIDGSATLTPEFVEIVNCGGESGLPDNIPLLLTACHSSVNFDRRLPQISNTFGVKLCQDFVQCGPQIDESASALVLLSDTILPVFEESVVEFSFIIHVNDVSFPVIFTIPTQIIDFFRANGPNVLETVSQLIGQFGGLLELSDDPSKTALGVSDKFGDIRCQVDWKMLEEMLWNVSLLTRQMLSKQRKSTVPQFDDVELIAHSVHQNDCSASSNINDVPNEIYAVKLVTFFESKRYTFTVHSNRISFPIGPDSLNVEFGIPLSRIENILVYEMTTDAFLIVIRASDEQLYLSGHSRLSSEPIFVKTQITSYSSSGKPNLFESIEFDPNNNLQFQINTTNWRKMFSIDNQDGSIRQLDCQWKK